MATRRRPAAAPPEPAPPPIAETQPVKARSKKPASPKPTSLQDVINRHNNVTLEIAFMDALFEIVSERFCHHDGLEPQSLVLTSDGRRVPESVVISIMARLRDAIHAPLIKELDELKKVTL